MPLLDNIDFPSPLSTPFTDDNGYTWDWAGTTWERRTKGFIGEAPIDATPYVRIDADWQQGMFSDPGATDVIYARKNGGWIEVIDAGTGITDAPTDSKFYGRKDAAWVEPSIADMPVIQAELDSKADASHTHVLADITDSDAMAAEADAPDASTYGRKLGAWVALTPAAGIVFNESITIINPQDTDDGTLLFTTAAITLTKLNAHIVGAGTSVTSNIQFAATRDGIGTDVFNADIVLDQESGESAVPDSASIPANSWIWLNIVSVSGAPEMLHVTLTYSQD